MTPIKCFMLESLRTSRYSLRRYSPSDICPGKLGYHDARSAPIGDVADDPDKPWIGTRPPAIDNEDPRWPAACSCGYVFSADDSKQVFAEGLYRRVETGEILTDEEAPAGAIWDASWWPSKGEDGHAWVIKLPDGSEWMTEGKATNCNCPDDPKHRCWTRNGTVPNLTVAPSLQTTRWHGWLRDGKLVVA